MEGIRAVFDNITCHILIEILSSLCGDLHNLFRPPQVILYPLSSSVDLRRPSADVATTLLVVEPCQPGGVVLIPDARRCYVTVVEAVVGDSKRFSDWKWSFLGKKLRISNKQLNHRPTDFYINGFYIISRVIPTYSDIFRTTPSSLICVRARTVDKYGHTEL